MPGLKNIWLLLLSAELLAPMLPRRASFVFGVYPEERVDDLACFFPKEELLLGVFCRGGGGGGGGGNSCDGVEVVGLL